MPTTDAGFNRTPPGDDVERRPAMSIVLTAASLALTAGLAGALLDAQRRRRELERRLAAVDTMAHTDPLTGLANRAGLHRGLTRQLATTEPGESSAVILLDIDGLKPINDRYGHDVGDAVIVEVAQRIARLRSRVACSARLGGDEFVVLLAPQPNPTTAAQYAERFAYTLCASIAQPFVTQDQPITVTASAGVAVMPASDSQRLLTAADLAMYRAKINGLGVCRYQPQFDGAAEPIHRPAVRLRDKRARGSDAELAGNDAGNDWLRSAGSTWWTSLRRPTGSPTS
jgi:diguanylate cyclase (GGDEF)-like protein